MVIRWIHNGHWLVEVVVTVTGAVWLWRRTTVMEDISEGFESLR